MATCSCSLLNERIPHTDINRCFILLDSARLTIDKMLARKKRKENAQLSGLKLCRDQNRKAQTKEKAKINDSKDVYFSHMKSKLEFSKQDIKSWTNFLQFLYKPMDPASLGATRILFGLIMMLDIPEERGLSDADIKWGDPNECRFPLFNFLKPLPLQWMCMVYLVMWMGAFGITLGLFYRISCLAFAIPYWYIFLLDKSTWNNHSYLYGILSILFLGSQAHHFWSLDITLGRVKKDTPVPLWNYFILRFQVFLLYFFAGLKKMDRDWLEGYSVAHLSYHWVFDPFRILLTPEQVDFWIIHLNGFLLDLTIGFLLLVDKTRPLAMCLLSMFHLMNSQIFSIGMFPYVCLATMPIFCDTNWPRKLLAKLPALKPSVKSCGKTKISTEDTKPGVDKEKEASDSSETNQNFTWKHKLVTILLISHIGVQSFLPYSHFITKGYNNWTNGLYGYSWDMMVHTWDTILVVIKVVDNESGKEHFVDPEAWVQSERWVKHADMVVQYAQCLERNLMNMKSSKDYDDNEDAISNNISVYLDVWCSLNGRFQQRMFDPRVDLLTVEWSPFKEVIWLMPLLNEFSSWRTQMANLEKEVYSWSNYTDVLFVADFPGLALENYINNDLNNVTLLVLEGEVIVESAIAEKRKEGKKKQYKKVRERVNKHGSIKIPSGKFHKVHTVSATPACYMYTYTNITRQLYERHKIEDSTLGRKRELLNELYIRLENIIRAIGLVSNAFLNVLYSVPMIKRVRVG